MSNILENVDIADARKTPRRDLRCQMSSCRQWAAIALSLALLSVQSTAWASPILFHTHVNPKTTDQDTTWLTNPNEAIADPDPDNPDAMQHQHRDRHALNGQAIRGTGGDATNPTETHAARPAAPGTPPVPARAALGFSTFAVWDNHNYRFGGFSDAPLTEYAHGFIEAGQDVTYRFVDSFAPDRRYKLDKPNKFAPKGEGKWNTNEDAKSMRDTINAAFTMWETAVNGQDRNVNGVPIKTRIGFEQTRKNAADIYVHLGVDGTDLGTWNPTLQYLSFRLPDRLVPPPDGPGGSEFDYDPADGIAAHRFDFLSVALHEIAHVLGLGHFGATRTDNLLGGALGKGVVGAGIDLGSLDGAKDLYSIPCPAADPAPQQRSVLQGAQTGAACPLCGCGDVDFGDAPDSYKTLLASDGPRYEEGNLQRLGRLWDSEPDGQPTPLADGDDLSLLGGFPDPVDDEDGIIFGRNSVDVILNIARDGFNDYLLRAWWDLNENACFDHLTADTCNTTSELIIDDLLTLAPGTYTRHYDLPFDPRDFYSRFRLTWDPADRDVWPHKEFVARTNLISHGEVEDYAPVPEPTTFCLFAVGWGLAWIARREKPLSDKFTCPRHLSKELGAD